MLYYHGVENRCALDLEKVPGVPEVIALEILREKGLEVVKPDIVALARKHIGAKYQREAEPSDAPEVFNCRTFVKWLYGQIGIFLPQNFRRWVNLGNKVSDLQAGDLVFTTGPINYGAWVQDDEGARIIKIGHVGMATCSERVIHAAPNLGVAEVQAELFFRKGICSAARRLMSQDTISVIVPDDQIQDIETSDDLMWLIQMEFQKRGQF